MTYKIHATGGARSTRFDNLVNVGISAFRRQQQDIIDAQKEQAYGSKQVYNAYATATEGVAKQTEEHIDNLVAWERSLADNAQQQKEERDRQELDNLKTEKARHEEVGRNWEQLTPRLVKTSTEIAKVIDHRIKEKEARIEGDRLSKDPNYNKLIINPLEKLSKKVKHEQTEAANEASLKGDDATSIAIVNLSKNSTDEFAKVLAADIKRRLDFIREQIWRTMKGDPSEHTPEAILKAWMDYKEALFSYFKFKPSSKGRKIISDLIDSAAYTDSNKKLGQQQQKVAQKLFKDKLSKFKSFSEIGEDRQTREDALTQAAIAYRNMPGIDDNGNLIPSNAAQQLARVEDYYGVFQELIRKGYYKNNPQLLVRDLEDLTITRNNDKKVLSLSENWPSTDGKPGLKERLVTYLDNQERDDAAAKIELNNLNDEATAKKVSAEYNNPNHENYIDRSTKEGRKKIIGLIHTHSGLPKTVEALQKLAGWDARTRAKPIYEASLYSAWEDMNEEQFLEIWWNLNKEERASYAGMYEGIQSLVVATNFQGKQALDDWAATYLRKNLLGRDLDAQLSGSALNALEGIKGTLRHHFINSSVTDPKARLQEAKELTRKDWDNKDSGLGERYTSRDPNNSTLTVFKHFSAGNESWSAKKYRGISDKEFNDNIYNTTKLLNLKVIPQQTLGIVAHRINSGEDIMSVFSETDIKRIRAIRKSLNVNNPDMKIRDIINHYLELGGFKQRITTLGQDEILEAQFEALLGKPQKISTNPRYYGPLSALLDYVSQMGQLPVTKSTHDTLSALRAGKKPVDALAKRFPDKSDWVTHGPPYGVRYNPHDHTYILEDEEYATA